MENNKRLIIGVVIFLALLNGVAILYKFAAPKTEIQTPVQSPFQQQVDSKPQDQAYNSDNGQMSVLPKTQPFVTAPQIYGSIKPSNSNSYNIAAQDYRSWSIDWEKSRTN